VKGELFKFLTEVFSSTPIVAIIIDEVTEELKEAVEGLPLVSRIIEFKTFAREGVGLGVHAHLFEPLYTIEKISEEQQKEKAKRILEVESVSYEEAEKLRQKTLKKAKELLDKIDKELKKSA
jgi:hypothetical protein